MSSNAISQVTQPTPPPPQQQTVDADPPQSESPASPTVPNPKPVTTTANTNPSRQGGETQQYDHDTVLVLLKMMKRAEYGDRKQQKKSLKEVFSTATELARKENGISRSPKAWQKKFTRMKQEYSAFVAKISESGRGGDDEDLYDTPEFYQEMHELERSKARHDPPAVLSTDQGSAVSDLPLTSTRKRVKLSQTSLMESLFEQQAKRQDEILAEMKRSNDEKSKMRSVMERLVEKL